MHRLPSPPARVASIVAIAATGLVLAACSAGPSPDASGESSRGPLDTILAAAQGTDVDDAAFAAQNDRIEELMAECMAAEGFEYTPQRYTAGTPGEWAPDDRSWVGEWGYGAVTWPGKTETEQAAEEGDANSAYVATLTESEADAYQAVLYGPVPTEEELATDDGVVTWEEQGCYGSASHEVRGDDPTRLSEHAPLLAAIDAFRADEAGDPALTDLDEEWADCMADAGHAGFRAQADAEQSIYDALEDYYLSLEEWVADSPELDRLHGEEVELALADLGCREQTDYRARSQEVRWTAEEQFIADHREEIDALLADAAGGSGTTAG